jgi:hypothetical protein
MPNKTPHGQDDLAGDERDKVQKPEIQPTFWSDWKSRGPFEKVSFGLGVVAVFMGIPAIIGLWSHGLETLTTIIIFAVQNVFLVVMFATLLFRERQIRARIERKLQDDDRHFGFIFSRLTSTFHSLSHQDRDLMNRVDNTPRSLPLHDTVETLSGFCDEVKNLFDHIFSRERLKFHVTIKAIVQSDEKANHSVAVLARDYELRKHHSFQVQDSQLQRIHENTAFEHLLDSETTDFCDDNLNKRRHYKNSSPSWKTRYNATMVVPIRRSNVEKGDIFELVGFVGIDCMKNTDVKNVFCLESGENARPELKDILLGYADCIYGILKRGTTYSGPHTALPGDYRIDVSNLSFVMAIHQRYLKRDLPGSSPEKKQGDTASLIKNVKE